MTVVAAVLSAYWEGNYSCSNKDEIHDHEDGLQFTHDLTHE